MGQYYKPVSLDKLKEKDKNETWLYTHQFGHQGLKIMEHSYLQNDFMQAVEVLLTPFGPWYKHHIVWAGDYADSESERKQEGLNSLDVEESGNIYDMADEDRGLEPIAPYIIQQIKDENKIDLDEYRYIVNHDEKLFVDKQHVKAYKASWMDEGEEGWKIHPLSLLVAEGNGRGGGDYYEGSSDYELVGSWARQSISIEKEIPEGYTELEVSFKE